MNLFVLMLALLAAPEQPAKVVLIGIDGVSLNVLEPLIAKGATPNLAQLIEKGARGHLDSIWPLRTPQVWTSAVTGKLPGQHGIWDHLSNTYYNPPGFKTEERRVVTRRERRSKALWNLLDAKGIRSLVVGWMVTWPPEKLEHGVIAAPIELMGDKRQTTIKGSFYRGVKEVVQPETLSAKVHELIVDPSDITAEELKPFADIPPKGSPLYALPRLERYTYTYSWSLARARSVEALAIGLLDDAKPDVVLAYFQCPDSMGHRFWIFRESVKEIEERLKTHGISTKHVAELKSRFERSFEACYRDVDARVGRILAATRGPETLVLVTSDHGFGYMEKPHTFKSEPYGGVHLDEGIIIATGPGIKAGSWIDKASILDLTPSILHHFGLPVADDMRGKVIGSLFGTDPKRIPTYESKPQLDAPHAEGWPRRKGPLRPTAAQMNGKKPW